MGVKLSSQACEISGCTQCSTLISTSIAGEGRGSKENARILQHAVYEISFLFALHDASHQTQSSKLQFFRPAAKMDISTCQLSTCQHSGDCQAQDMKVETAVDDFFPLTFV